MFRSASDKQRVLVEYTPAIVESEKTQVELDGVVVVLSDDEGEGEWEEIDDSSTEEKKHLKKADPKGVKKSRRDFKAHSKIKYRSRLQSVAARPILNKPSVVSVTEVTEQTPFTATTPDESLTFNGTPLQSTGAEESLIGSSIDESLALHPFLQASSSTPMSRELKELQHSVCNSKILSKFVSDVSLDTRSSKRRRSNISPREDKDLSEDSINKRLRKSSLEKKKRFVPLKSSASSSENSDSLKRGRSKSEHPGRNDGDIKVALQKWPSDEKVFKRDNMRSQNEFLNRVQRRIKKRMSTNIDAERRPSNVLVEDQDMPDNSSMMVNFSESQFSVSSIGSTVAAETDNSIDAAADEERLRTIWQPSPKCGWDSFCWKCRKCSGVIGCSTCVRSFHPHCLKMNAQPLKDDWLCPECVTVENGLTSMSRKTRRIDFSLDSLNAMLSFAVKRMEMAKQPWPYFLSPEGENHPIYKRYIAHSVTFNSLKAKVEKKAYRCPEEFISDTKWIVHNALITSNSQKAILSAKAVLKICRQEVQEIETCPDCYLAANTKPDWFIDVCSRPHMLVWAKLKGFPFWPAKVMGPGNGSLVVNVRFFGEHDRAFVRLKDCFLYSEEEPTQPAGKRGSGELAGSCKEAALHIEKIRNKIGSFKFAPNKTPYNPADEINQLESMMPGVMEYTKRVLAMPPKQSLQYKFVKTAGTYISKMIQKDSSHTPSSDIEGAREDSGVSVTISPDLSASKRKLSEANDVADVSKVKIVTKAKYEVISKNSATNDSTKLGTVILKKKSICSENRRIEESDSTTAASATQPANTTEVPVHAGHVPKRKHGSDGNEKHKGKHSKHDHKVPCITIKTIHALSQDMEIEEVVPQVPGKELTTVQTAAPNEVVPQVPSSEPTPLQTAAPTQQTANNGPQQSPPTQDDKSANEDIAKSQPDSAKVGNKNVVPFIEIKQEPLSDYEGDNKNTDLNSSHTTDVPGASASASDVELPQPIIAQADTPSEEHEPNKKADSPFLVLPIKEEKVSDSETEPADSIGTLTSPVKQPIQNVRQPLNTIQIVGQTSILRIPPKPAVAAATVTAAESQASLLPKSSNGNANAAVPHSAAETASQQVSSSAGNVPFGPLSAAATAALLTSGDTNGNGPVGEKTASTSTSPSPPNLIQTPPVQPQKTPSPTASQGLSPKTRSIQRARKTFPNPPPHEVDHATTPVTNSNNFMNNCMISIPAHLASSSSANPLIPVPPLTAVGKAPQLTTAVGVVNITFPTSAPAAPAGLTNANSAPLFMSAPPPLAGLSQPSLPETQPALPQHSDPPVPTLAHISVFCCASTAVTGTNTTATATTLPITTAISTTNTAIVSKEPAVSIGASSTSSLTSTAGAPLCSPSSTASSNPADTRTLTDVQTNTNPSTSGTTDLNSCPSELPRLTRRPISILSSSGSDVFPSQAGPAHMKLVQGAHKLTDFFLLVMTDTMKELTEGEGASADAKLLQLNLELERTKKAHETEVADLKLKIAEMRKTMDNERNRIQEVRQQCEAERLRSVEETKKVTWCANCKNEANFYCCWNTSYCGYACQVKHWPSHRSHCANTIQTAGPPRKLAFLPHDPLPESSQQQTQTSTPPPLPSQLAHTLQRNQNSTASQTNQPQVGKKTIQLNPVQVPVPPNKMAATVTKSSPQAATKNKNKKEKEKPTRPITITAKPTSELMKPTSELLKLPTNTYLRPVVSVSNNVPNRPQPGYPIQAQRINIPLPITTTSQHYQIMQCNSGPWDYMGHTTPNTAVTAAMNPTNNITLNQQLLTRKFNNGLSIKSTPGRNRNGNMASLTFNTTLKGDQQRPH